MKDDKDRLDFAHGSVLLMVADTYPSVHRALLEAVQNALDAMRESNPHLNRIGIILDKKKRRATVRDNGCGVTIEKFQMELLSVGISKKTKLKGSLGRFGRGVISPIGKCERYTLTSCPEKGGGYNQWEFVTEDIRKQAHEINIPRKSLPNMVYRPKVKEGTVQWRTQMDIINYTSDRAMSDIGSARDLKESILGRYGTTMRRKKVRLDLRFVNEDSSIGDEVLSDVMAEPYDGEMLGEVKYKDADAGEVVCNLYVARQGPQGRKGVVYVGELGNDYRFKFVDMARTARRWLSPTVVKVLTSGVFTGEFVANRIQLHPDRERFVENDAFVGFCASIETWYKSHGEPCMNAIEEDKRDERYQDAAQAALETIASLIKEPQFQEWRNFLNKLPGSEPGGDQNSMSAGSFKKGGEHDNEKPGVRHPKRTKRKTDSDIRAHGPKGKTRTSVSCDGLSLLLKHVEDFGSSQLWDLDVENGVLYINMAHPAFVMCDSGKRKLSQLHEYLLVQALTVYTTASEDWRELLSMYVEEATMKMAYFFSNSSSFNLRS